MEVYKLAFSAQTTDGNGIAALDIREDGFIVAINMTLDILGADVLNDGAIYEVSFASTTGILTNDTKASLAACSVYLGAITTGGHASHGSTIVTGLAIAVAAGERMYLHIDVNGTVSASGQCYLYTMPSSPVNSRAANRRV